MAADDPIRIESKLAGEVVGRAKPGEPALALLKPGMTPAGYLDALIGGEEFADAAKFLAHALPRREAVWWACRCVRKADAGRKEPIKDPTQAGAEARALAATEAWASDPSESNRRAAAAVAEEAGYGTAAGCAALAAFWCGDTLGPPGLPAIPPAEHLAAHGVASSIFFSVIVLGPENAPASYRAFLADGLAVARGEDRWPDAPAAAPVAPLAVPRPAATRAMAATPASKEPATRRNLNWD